MQGKSHDLQVKESYGNSNWLLVSLHPATRGVQCTPSVSSFVLLRMYSSYNLDHFSS